MVLPLHLDRLGEGELEAMPVVPPKASDHLLGLEHPAVLAVPAVVRRGDEPQMLGATHGARAVLSTHSEDLTPALWVDADNRGREAIRTDHQVADGKGADRLEPGRSQHLPVERLRPAAHEC